MASRRDDRADEFFGGPSGVRVVAKQATTATAFGAGPRAGPAHSARPAHVPQSPTDAVRSPGSRRSLGSARAWKAKRERPDRSRGIAPASTSKTQLDEQTTQAQAEVEAAAKRVAETQADVASKSNLTEDHPDMRAARLAADAAARQLHEARVRLGVSSSRRRRCGRGPLRTVRSGGETASRGRPDRRAARPSTGHRRGGLTAGGQPRGADRGRARDGLAKDGRALNEAKARHENLKLRAERVKLALEAARAQASERIAIIDPPYRPTHPSKGGRSKVAFGGLATACLLALGYAALRLTLDDTLVDAEDIEALEVAGVLGVVPRIRLRALEGLRRGAV